MWVGSLNHGLLQYKSGRFSPARLPWDNVRVLFDDSQNHLWVGGLVNLLNVSGDRRTEFGQQEGFVDGHAIGAVAEDAAGTIWVGTGPGELWRYAGGRFTRFEPPADWPSVRFAAVLPDTNGVVWVGTLGGGLYRFENGRFARCGATDGLPDNNVTQLLDSRDGFIWGGTYNGIFRARKEDLAAAAASGAGPVPCRVFGKSDGLPSLECSSGFQPCCWRSEDGRLWFSTANGVAAVDPAKILLNPTPPMVIVEEMLVNGSPVPLTPHIGGPLRPANPPPRIRIPPGRAYVQFRFTGLNFAAPDAVRFRLKLDGGGGTWQDTGHQRLMSYGPLAPGDYVFRVMAANNEGIWNEQGDTLAFTVEPYLWEEPWFRAGLVAVALACMGIIVAIVQRQRYRRRLDRVDRQREMEHERARIAHDLHDDLGANLTQIGILSALANRESTPAGEARDLIREVRTRAREMVIALDEIVWAVNPRNDSLGGLVNYLGHFAEEFFRPSDIRFRMDLPADLPPVPLSSESRHHVFLAFKEAVNNAARHSHAREANMRAWTDNSELVIALEDDGRGFDAGAAAKKGAGNGLGIMKLRLEKVGGRTVIRGGAGGGSCVEFHVPLKNS